MPDREARPDGLLDEADLPKIPDDLDSDQGAAQAREGVPYVPFKAAFDRYHEAKVAFQAAMAGSDVEAQRRCRDALFNDAFRDLGDAVYWLAKGGPEDREEIRQEVLKKLLERDQPGKVGIWLRDQILRAAIPLSDQIGQELLEFSAARPSDNVERRRALRDQIATEIRRVAVELGVRSPKVDAILEVVERRKRSSKNPKPSKAAQWLRGQIWEAFFPEPALVPEALGNMVLAFEQKGDAGAEDGEQALRDLRPLVGDLLPRSLQDREQTIGTILTKIRNRNHPGAVYNWLRKRVIPTTSSDFWKKPGKNISLVSLVDLKKLRRRSRPQEADDDEEIEVPDDCRPTPEESTAAAEQLRLWRQARYRACKLIKQRWPRYQAEKARRVFELWIWGSSEDQIRRTILTEFGWSFKAANVYQVVTRYRAKLLEIRSQLTLEEQDIIDADIEASRRKSPSGSGGKARPKTTKTHQP